MPTEAPPRPVTADELLALPDDGLRRELVRGKLREMAPAGSEHGMIAVDVATSLNQHVRENDLGRVFAAETGFRIATDPDTVRAPDVAFVQQERIEAVGRVEGYWPGAPDLAVEVVSPHDTYMQVEEKVFDWLDAGARLVIVVNPRRQTVTVYRSREEVSVLGAEDTLDGGEVVPGWALPVGSLFA